MSHPRDVLLGAQASGVSLPVCDHYSGVEARMRKSLQLQAEMTQEFGTCVFDVTLDCEDGAPVGGEAEHAALVTELALSAAPEARVAVRVHPVDHPSFQADIATIGAQAAHRLTHIMVPKVESVADVQLAEQALIQAGAKDLALHVLIESPAAVHRAFDIAAQPRVQSLSFGLMDFVSAHAGAIPAHGMSGQGQFTHPLVVRAKLDIASACHAHGKVPSHCVVTEFNDVAAMRTAAQRAAHEFGYTRMWSIHPAQIRPILEAMAPDAAAIEVASEIVLAARAAHWAPISHKGQLHDRASYRFFWQVLERAHSTGRSLPAEVQLFFKD
ncbi:MAG: CoA ester lyase [Burkholderiales bacterium 35-55-47]|uniref:HpcH/HpaI aldolase/citrate lyase family protein n=1 Tax=Limnohabitans sp. TaxID=1907725 RepID=UPI000BC8D5BA|nr:aldolase/citrate lyase family protein [Limnohabitans sp.]OYY19218.1 MAG: CoA ester lyase [Burkholderiales bacterium 35-55-47]OYZ73227.1 MAG: CoA ester lyase [Burkholderiales bacterium 24-55-52]OZB00256.1 MAG: CoA ester lyase [Burkholderiales bacterium 39-55-53]HQR87539.1 aldolase/citrate lyase family protein [Limnohabitans sp.]HQS27562.1 aldolase/citrate lyase family protein [Limnohabitans sp.]